MEKIRDILLSKIDTLNEDDQKVLGFHQHFDVKPTLRHLLVIK
ncbi:hypothetical protein QUF88_01130 [Bacillus sp. DX1.1]|nr:hypothetical protein [Bacillus sp. DX1.1]